ncbi:MAG: hypothetical protein ABEJ08_00335 [Halobacteriaceae archaeon]
MADHDLPKIAIGETLYDEDGNRVGTVRGFETDGLSVATAEGIKSLSTGHARAGGSFGEAHLVWRCAECGAVGDIEGGVPAACPDCDAPREALYYRTED